VGFVLILLLAAFAAAWNQRAHWRRMACMEVQGLTMAQLRDCLSKLGASDSLGYGLDLAAVEVGVSCWSWGETVYASATAPDRAVALSRCTIPQFTSWEKNDDNLVVVANAVLALGGRTSRRDRKVASARWHDISTRLGASA